MKSLAERVAEAPDTGTLEMTPAEWRQLRAEWDSQPPSPLEASGIPVRLVIVDDN